MSQETESQRISFLHCKYSKSVFCTRMMDTFPILIVFFNSLKTRFIGICFCKAESMSVVHIVLIETISNKHIFNLSFCSIGCFSRKIPTVPSSSLNFSIYRVTDFHQNFLAAFSTWEQGIALSWISWCFSRTSFCCSVHIPVMHCIALPWSLWMVNTRAINNSYIVSFSKRKLICFHSNC